MVVLSHKHQTLLFLYNNIPCKHACMNYILPYLGDMQDIIYKHCFITIYHPFRECFSFTNFIILISQILKILLILSSIRIEFFLFGYFAMMHSGSCIFLFLMKFYEGCRALIDQILNIVLWDKVKFSITKLFKIQYSIILIYV